MVIDFEVKYIISTDQVLATYVAIWEKAESRIPPENHGNFLRLMYMY